VSEWAVKNQRVELTPGCSEHVTSSFRVGPHTGQAWMRVTLTNVPVSDDFPWAGSVGTVNGDFSGGETEDHLAFITTVVEVEPPPRSALRLAVPRPNPFRVASAIHYDLTRAGPVRLAVFDVAGRAVRVLAWTVQPGGSHTVFWDGTDEFGGLVASGVYVVRLEAEQRVLARRVVVAR
jgi:hypothetical protein